MLNLPPDLQEVIERHLASGRFANVEEVLRAALDQLDDAGISELKDSLVDEEAGRIKPLADVAAEVREKLGFADSA